MPTEQAVLVTGASTGIGRATALLLTDKGFRVYAGVRKDADGEALRQAAPGLVPVRLDVTEAEQIAQAAAIIAADTGELTGLVNNAGVGLPDRSSSSTWTHCAGSSRSTCSGRSP